MWPVMIYIKGLAGWRRDEGQTFLNMLTTSLSGDVGIPDEPPGYWWRVLGERGLSSEI